jgi:zinc protease
MITYDRFELSNKLRLLVHVDKSTPLAAVNILYDVGSRDEDPEKTGFAHLFEHLMFSGSANIPRYDEPLQNAGGENNAFTSTDITNYYLTLPANNLETAFWLESDRMMNLAFSEKGLEVQRNVVCEEFKQRYLNQPYGETWLILRQMAYHVHPYQWPTIGKKVEHIENAVMQDVRDFFSRFYCPANAIMVVAGNVDPKEVVELAEKWFGPIPSGKVHKRNLPVEPVQRYPRRKSIRRDVPVNAIYKAYHTCKRWDPEYYADDLLSDILSSGYSSRLYINLVKEKRLFSEINAYITAEFDNGLFVVTGKIMDGVSMDAADMAIREELNLLKKEIIDTRELQKVKNKMESRLLLSEIGILNKALNLAMAELAGDPELVNSEADAYNKVTAKDIQQRAKVIFNESNCSTLRYFTKETSEQPTKPKSV